MSNYTEDRAEYDFEVIRGEGLEIPFLNWVEDGVPFDFTGKDIRMDIKQSIEICRYSDLQLREGEGITVSGNNLTVTLTGDQTEKLHSGTYYYDLVIDDIVYIRGKIKPTGRVTK